MKTAICGKCGFSMRIRKIVPAACPVCGYNKTKEDMKAGRAQEVRAKAIDFMRRKN